MANLVLITMALGMAAMFYSGLALISARRTKKASGQSSLALTAFWVSVFAYMLTFTALRTAYWQGTGDIWLPRLFYAQTIAGASTIISLASIMFGALLPPSKRNIVATAFLFLATFTVSLIFWFGIEKTASDHWGIEYLPNSTTARVMVALVYMIMPTAMSIMVTLAARGMPPPMRGRLLWFSASVVLMYLPNAIKYVFAFDGAINAILALIMAFGTFVGWKSYNLAPPSSGNG